MLARRLRRGGVVGLWPQQHASLVVGLVLALGRLHLLDRHRIGIGCLRRQVVDVVHAVGEPAPLEHGADARVDGADLCHTPRQLGRRHGRCGVGSRQAHHCAPETVREDNARATNAPPVCSTVRRNICLSMADAAMIDLMKPLRSTSVSMVS